MCKRERERERGGYTLVTFVHSVCVCVCVCVSGREEEKYHCCTPQLMVKAAKEEQLKQVEYVLVAHRCVGVTAQIVEKGSVRIRFETSYKGTKELNYGIAD